ncbi:MAG: terminase small subunit [Oscillospiraceae bacterium]|nr:terminase small subunit [Oscillospiraceae bacterium]
MRLWYVTVEDERGGDELVKKREKKGSDQVAEFLFEVMQGKPTEKEQLKAAELLGKYLGMFEKKEVMPEARPVEIVGAELLED